MTREEAIAYGKECLSWNEFSKGMKMYQFIEMAIKALSQEPTVEKDPCETCGYAEGSPFCLQYCPYDAERTKEQEPCDDAISRDAVLEKAVYTETEEGWWGYTVDVDYIKSLPSVTQKSGKWIPVSEKLPSDCNEDWVLAQIQEDNGHLWIPCVAEYRKNTDDWNSDANDIGWLKNHRGCFKVIAWMPLPKPYEPQESEE